MPAPKSPDHSTGKQTPHAPPSPQGSARKPWKKKSPVEVVLEQEEKLRKDEGELRRLLEVVPQQIFVLEAEGRVEYVNQAIIDQLGAIAHRGAHGGRAAAEGAGYCNLD